MKDIAEIGFRVGGWDAGKGTTRGSVIMGAKLCLIRLCKHSMQFEMKPSTTGIVIEL